MGEATADRSGRRYGRPVTQRRSTGELERDVLRCLTEHPEGLTSREARTLLGGDLATTTLGTILVRLHTKGLVDRKVDGRGFRYVARVSPDEVMARRMHAALRDADDRKAVMAHFVGDLTVREAHALRRLLDGLDG